MSQTLGQIDTPLTGTAGAPPNQVPGANGGAGGFGGDSWNSNLSVGGEGGTIFPATINRVALGGGGGAGAVTGGSLVPSVGGGGFVRKGQ